MNCFSNNVAFLSSQNGITHNLYTYKLNPFTIYVTHLWEKRFAFRENLIAVVVWNTVKIKCLVSVTHRPVQCTRWLIPAGLQHRIHYNASRQWVKIFVLQIALSSTSTNKMSKNWISWATATAALISYIGYSQTSRRGAAEYFKILIFLSLYAYCSFKRLLRCIDKWLLNCLVLTT